MPINTTKYRGKVDITYHKGKSKIKKATHNAGMPDMALIFAKALSGNLSSTDDLPRLIDIGYEVPSTDYSSEDSGVWMSILNSPVNIGGRQYTFDSSLNNWVAVLTSTVYYSDLNGGILDDVIKNVDEGNYNLEMRLCSYNKKNRKYLAHIPLSTDDITTIRDMTSAIVMWYTELLYDEEDTGTMKADIVVDSSEGSN